MRNRARASILLAAVLAAATPAHGAEVLQAVLVELTAIEVNVILAGARPPDRVQCLLRDAEGHVRVGSVERVWSGITSGGITVLSMVLPLLAPTEREFSVVLMRDLVPLHATAWKPLR
ncbi:MAG TPA: hypothetical protein VMT79_08910 [Candidatus Binatia bacterium]|nr:hypothetical protein [Candidatus Binatia bacterium]